MIINNLDELDDIKIREFKKNYKLEMDYLKRCFTDVVFDTEWSDEADEGQFNYVVKAGVELEEFTVEIYVEPTWDTELRGRLDFNNYMLLSIENRDGDDIKPTEELADYIISKIKSN